MLCRAVLRTVVECLSLLVFRASSCLADSPGVAPVRVTFD
jgi:hypothetical protein